MFVCICICIYVCVCVGVYVFYMCVYCMCMCVLHVCAYVCDVTWLTLIGAMDLRSDCGQWR